MKPSEMPALRAGGLGGRQEGGTSEGLWGELGGGGPAGEALPAGAVVSPLPWVHVNKTPRS